MRVQHLPRWALSLADISMLLLGFFILLHAGDAREVAAGARAAFSTAPLQGPLLDSEADALFEPGEARLNDPARRRLAAMAAVAARAERRLVVESKGRDPAARRFDGWELAAARAAAVARALEDGGLKDGRVAVAMPGTGRKDEAGKQRLIVRYGG